MKKLLLVLSLFCATTVPTTTECGLFDTAMEFLQNNGMDLLKKGAQLVSDNSDKIFGTIQDLTGIDAAAMAEKAKSLIPGPLYDKAKSMLLGDTTKEADREEAIMDAKAQEIIDTTPGLTEPEKQTIKQEAKVISTQNRAALEKAAIQSIEQKRSAIKQATYAKYGKGTPIN